MSPQQLSAAIAAAIMVAVSAVLLALVALRRSRRTDEQVRRRLVEFQRLLDQADNRIARPDGTRPSGPDDPAGAGRSTAADKADEIARLAVQGLDAIEIARRMNVDVGEVELMINLHKCPSASS